MDITLHPWANDTYISSNRKSEYVLEFWNNPSTYPLQWSSDWSKYGSSFVLFFFWTQRHMLNIESSVDNNVDYNNVLSFIAVKISSQKHLYKMVQHYWGITIFCYTYTRMHTHKVKLPCMIHNRDWTLHRTILCCRQRLTF